MNRAAVRLSLAALVLISLTTLALGRGGGGGGHGGGGFGGGGGGSYHGGGSFGGGGGYHGASGYSGGYSGYHGASEYRGGSQYHADSNSHAGPSIDHSRSYSPSHEPSTRPNSGWSNYGRSASGERSANYGSYGREQHGDANHGNRPDPNHHPDWYHGNWNNHDDHHWHYGPAAWWAAGWWAGADLAAPWAWGYWPYDNPYYCEPVIVDGATIDYSQPLPLSTTQYSVNDELGDRQQAPAEAADQVLDGARSEFAQGDYADALSQCEKAIAQNPSDTASHEFRGLVLFVLHRYKEAAGTLYSVLSTGPGWDWNTMSSFYSSVETYTEQLRALEQYVRSNPDVAEARFLLAYHYLTDGYSDAAVTEFKKAVQLNPKDRLSAQIVRALTSANAPEAPAPTVVAKPVDAAALVGDWKASPSDGTTIALSLTKDGKYDWKLGRNDKPQEFRGDYAVADGLLILKKDSAPVMVGQVTQLGDGRFNFKLPGASPGDPGLTFGK